MASKVTHIKIHRLFTG